MRRILVLPLCPCDCRLDVPDTVTWGLFEDAALVRYIWSVGLADGSGRGVGVGLVVGVGVAVGVGVGSVDLEDWPICHSLNLER